MQAKFSHEILFQKQRNQNKRGADFSVTLAGFKQEGIEVLTLCTP